MRHYFEVKKPLVELMWIEVSVEIRRTAPKSMEFGCGKFTVSFLGEFPSHNTQKVGAWYTIFIFYYLQLIL